jgi:hypothetical protein
MELVAVLSPQGPQFADGMNFAFVFILNLLELLFRNVEVFQNFHFLFFIFSDERQDRLGIILDYVFGFSSFSFHHGLFFEEVLF